MNRTCFRRLFWTALLLCLITAGKAWAEKTTLMIYMCGSNLESEYSLASRDIQEILDSGYDRNSTEILIMAGGSRSWGNGLSNSSTHICRVSPARTLVDVGVSNGLMNLGRADTLSWFLNWSADNYPANRYALIIWDHGGGPLQGVCWDELYPGDNLTIPELTEALQNSPFRSRPLEWIGFDACLMSSLETACQMAPYAKYMIASQEREPGTGWSYSFLRGMEADATGKDTGCRIIDAYMASPDSGRADKTLSCIDLSKARALSDALEPFFAEKNRQVSRESFPDLSRLRRNSLSFGINRAGDNNGYDLVDLGELLRMFQADASLMAALERTVAYSRSNIAGATGLSVYHPMLNASAYAGGWSQLYGQIGFSRSYAFYIQSFMGILTGDRIVYWSNLVTQAGKGDYTCRLTEEQAENYLDGHMVVMGKDLEDGADDAWYMLYTTDRITLDDNHVLHGTYEGQSLYLVDDAALFELAGPIEYQVQDGKYLIPLYPYVGDHEIVDTIMGVYTLNEATGDLELKEYMIYDWNLQNFTTRAEIDFSRYDGIAFERYNRNLRRNEFGEILPSPYWERDEHVSSLTYMALRKLNFRFVTHDLHEGIYQVMFEIQDSQNNWVASEPLRETNTVYPLEISLEWKGDSRLDVQPFGYGDDARTDRVTPLGLVVTNRSGTSMHVRLEDTKFNGIPLDIQLETVIAPGEKGVLAFPLDLDWLKFLRPQRVLREVSGLFRCWPDGQEAQAVAEPYRLTTEMSFASMYRSTSVLPEEDADWARPVTLAEGTDWQVALRGVSSLDGRVVLTLAYENRTKKALYFCPDLFRGDGTVWHHGVIQFSEVNGYNGNGLRIMPGQSEYAPPLLEVPAGETLIDYVQAAPESPDPLTLGTLSFRMHIYDLEKQTNFATEEIHLSFPRGLTVAEGQNTAVPEDGITPGDPAREERYGINNLSVESAVLSPPVSEADLITLSPPDASGAWTEGYYLIMSAVSSEEDLCARNFYITLDDRQYDLMSLRDTPLLIPVQMGLLQPEGGVLRARCLPWITTLHAGGGEELMLYVMSAWLSEDLLYQESLRPATFFSTGSGYYADEVQELSLGILPRNGTVFSSGALWFKYGTPEEAFDSIRADGPWPVLPEAARNEITQSDDWPTVGGYQTLPLRSENLRLELRRPEESDHLYVVFNLTDAQGNKVTLPPVPLSDYLPTEE